MVPYFKINITGFDNINVINNKLTCNSKIIISNQKQFCILYNNLKTKDIFIDKFSKQLFFKQNNYASASQKNFTEFSNFLQHHFTIFFKKIKFIGKGFRLQSFSKKKTIEFTFGHSHIYIAFLQNLFFKRISKQKYILYSNNIYNLLTFSQKINRIRPLSAYTLRGLRLAKAKILKRKGRKSPNL